MIRMLGIITLLIKVFLQCLFWVFFRMMIQQRHLKDLAYKETFPVKFIYTDTFMRSMFKALKNEEILSIGLDCFQRTCTLY